jgi:molybdate transport system substrate-binding protein
MSAPQKESASSHKLWRKLTVGLTLICLGIHIAAAQIPVVAAAADLKFALETISLRYSKETGRKVKLVFGSSGNLYQQIVQGAPFQLFLSADEDFVLRLSDMGKTQNRGTLYAIGRLVIIAPPHSPLRGGHEFEDLAPALSGGEIKKFAIANPEHAPYGRRAKEVLQRAGVWEKIKGRLVLGENVAQAAQFSVSGSTQGGIIAYSMALAPEVGRRGHFTLIPDSWHTPLKQRMVLIKGADPGAQTFYRYLQQKPARQIMQQYGFSLPGED